MNDPFASAIEPNSSDTDRVSRAPNHRILSAIDRHSGIAAAAGAVLTTLLKLSSVAHGEAGVMGEILRRQGAADLVVATLVAGVPALGWLAIVWTLPQVSEAIAYRDPLALPLTGLGTTVVILAVFIPARWFAVIALFGGTYLVTSIGQRLLTSKRTLARRAVRANIPRPTKSRAVSILICFSVGIAWLILVFNDQMWLPAEQISLSSGEIVVGYVLNPDGNDLVLLRDQPRDLVRLNGTAIAARGFCRIDDRDPRSLVNLLLRQERPKAPECP